MEKDTGTIFKVYLLDKTAKGQEEGFVQLWKHKGKLLKIKPAPFNSLDRIDDHIQRLLKAAKIEWPPTR